MGRDRCTIRFSQCHSVGSGVRPGSLPAGTDMNYLAHGTSLEEVDQISREGMSRRQRLHIHIYECGRSGDALEGYSARCGPDAALVISESQCFEDGIAFSRPPSNVAMSECIGGSIGPQYFRFTQRLCRDPDRRRVALLRHSHPVRPDGNSPTTARHRPQTAFARNNTDDEMHTTATDDHHDEEMHTAATDDRPETPALHEIGGLDHFSSRGSDSECSARTCGEGFFIDSTEDTAKTSRRSASKTYSAPYPMKSANRDVETTEEEAGPTFATYNAGRADRRTRANVKHGSRNCTAAPPTTVQTYRKPGRLESTGGPTALADSSNHPVTRVINDLAGLEDEVGELAGSSPDMQQGTTPNAPNGRDEQWGTERKGNMRSSCFYLRGHRDPRRNVCAPNSEVPAEKGHERYCTVPISPSAARRPVRRKVLRPAGLRTASQPHHREDTRRYSPAILRVMNITSNRH